MIDIPFHMLLVNPCLTDVVLTMDLQYHLSSFLDNVEDYLQSSIQQLPRVDLKYSYEWCNREGGRERGREGWRKGGREWGGRDGGREKRAGKQQAKRVVVKTDKSRHETLPELSGPLLCIDPPIRLTIFSCFPTHCNTLNSVIRSLSSSSVGKSFGYKYQSVNL